MVKKKSIMGEFDAMVEESNAFREMLLKIFNRKIKRIKKEVKENEDYDSEEEDEASRNFQICNINSSCVCFMERSKRIEVFSARQKNK